VNIAVGVREILSNQTVPTVVFPDGSVLVNPSAAQVKKRMAELATSS